MLRSLLGERFKLAVHTETKEQPIYALVMARNDGRLGPDLKKSDTDCAAVMAAMRGRGPGRGTGSAGRAHAMRHQNRAGQHVGRRHDGGAVREQSGMFVGRVVLDRTG